MRFAISVLIVVLCLVACNLVFANESDAKAKATAALALARAGHAREMAELAHVRAAAALRGKHLFVWVGRKQSRIVEKFADAVHVEAQNYRGDATAGLVLPLGEHVWFYSVEQLRHGSMDVSIREFLNQHAATSSQVPGGVPTSSWQTKLTLDRC